MENGRPLAERFEHLFNHLREEGYYWEPQTPDRLIACRREAASYPPLVRKYGLGLGGDPNGASDGTAVSRCGDWFVAHHHWDDREHREDLVYYGRESLELLRRMERDGILGRGVSDGGLRGASVLDLGSGSGALALSISTVARRVLGVELSATAVEWAAASAQAQGVGNVSFIEARIGTPEADERVRAYVRTQPPTAAATVPAWDAAIFNPPLAIPSGAPRPSRDGGELGVALPLEFAAFAHRHLRPGGRAYCHVTSPIVHGRSVFFDRLPRSAWTIETKRLLDPRFNQSLHRKDGYAGLGIERVELWYLCLRKNAR